MEKPAAEVEVKGGQCGQGPHNEERRSHIGPVPQLAGEDPVGHVPVASPQGHVGRRADTHPNVERDAPIRLQLVVPQKRIAGQHQGRRDQQQPNGPGRQTVLKQTRPTDGPSDQEHGEHGRDQRHHDDRFQLGILPGNGLGGQLSGGGAAAGSELGGGVNLDLFFLGRDADRGLALRTRTGLAREPVADLEARTATGTRDENGHADNQPFGVSPRFRKKGTKPLRAKHPPSR